MNFNCKSFEMTGAELFGPQPLYFVFIRTMSPVKMRSL